MLRAPPSIHWGPEAHIHEFFSSVIIGFGNVVSPVWHQAIIEKLCRIIVHTAIENKICSKIQHSSYEKINLTYPQMSSMVIHSFKSNRIFFKCIFYDKYFDMTSFNMTFIGCFVITMNFIYLSLFVVSRRPFKVRKIKNVMFKRLQLGEFFVDYSNVHDILFFGIQIILLFREIEMNLVYKITLCDRVLI